MATGAGLHASSGPSADPAAIPRDYNFAGDLFRRFNDRSWGEKAAYIDPRGTWSYRQLEDRALQFSAVLET